MQTIATRELLPNTNLTCVCSDQFKTGCISVNLITPLRKETASKNALIPRVLLRGTAYHPDMLSLSEAMDELYGACFIPLVRKKGEMQCVGLFADFVDDDFLPQGAEQLEKVASLLGELLISPKTYGGLLIGEYVESERKNLVDEIRAAMNDKRQYASDRLLKLMCAGENYGVSALGDEKSAAEISSLSLTRQYQHILATSRVEIFYCGSAPAARVETALKNALAALPRSGEPEYAGTEVVISPPKDAPRRFTEELDVTQGKLSVGFRVGKSMLAPSYPALMVFNALYGGSVTSKLFLNVRERLSLCYYASSALDKLKGVMIVSSGVEFDKVEDALREILAQLDAVKRGEISEWELKSARLAVVNAIRSAMESPYGLESLYFDQAVSDFKCTPEELAGLADTVTADEVRAIAEGVEPDTVFFLTGLKGGGADET